MGFCTKCGASLADGAQFCTSCGTPVGGARPMRQAQPAPQQYSGDNWGAYDDGFSGYSAPKKAAPSNRGILRAMSIIFAIGFLICAFGASGLIYYNREVSTLVDTMYSEDLEELSKAEKDSGMMAEELKEIREELRKKMDASRIEFGRRLAPQLRCDVIGVMKANIPDIREYTGDDKEAFRKEIENTKERVEEEIKKMSPEIQETRREFMAENNRENVEKVGFRYVWLIVSAYHTLIMIIGGALMLIALIAWLALGGTSGPLSETTVLPAVIACVALGVILIVVFGLAISPIKAEEMW